MSFKGSIIGAILLLSGSCIGVGMLFLPIVAGLSGFVPSVLIFVICWIFMISTAFLILELLLAFPQRKNLISLAEKTLGSWGKSLIYTTFLFLFYCVIIAYLVKGGELINFIVLKIGWFLPAAWLGALLLGLITMILIYSGAKYVDQFNRVCMISLFFAYIYLLLSGRNYVDKQYLEYQNWKLSIVAIPFFIVAFGFHNMLPSIKNYIGKDKRKLSMVVVVGGLIPFIIYFLWMKRILSVVPPIGNISILTSYKLGQLSTEPLSEIIQNIRLVFWVYYFSFFAIITSLFAQALSLLDFIADGFKRSKMSKQRLLISGIIFLPAFLLSQLIPNIFIISLEIAGGVLAIILFGIMPVLMVWRKRYHFKNQASRFIPGGKVVLSFILSFACFILLYQVAKNSGVVQICLK